MTRHSSEIRLRHMLDHAKEAVAMVQGSVRADLDRDRKLNLSLVRLVEIVGEAAARVPGDVQEQHPEIHWPEIISLRNRLIHGYDSIDFDILWSILQTDFPALIGQLESLLKES